MGLLGNITGGIIGTSDTEEASKDAAFLAGAAAKKSKEEYNEAWDDIEGYIGPYLEAGTEGLAAYKEAIGVSMDTPVFNEFDFDFTKMEENDAYKFIMDQEMQATDRLAAKNRALTSGNRLTATQDRAADVASTEYGKEWERQFKGNQYNNQLLAAKYGLDYQQHRDRVGDTAYMVQTGQNAATNLSGQRMAKAGAMTNIHTRQSADLTAANLLPAQEKQQYIGGLMNIAGMAAGA